MVCWLAWQQPYLASSDLEGLIVALGIGFAEELLFRGWLLDELQRDYCPCGTLGGCLIYAVLHFIKPPAEILRTLPFPALIAAGIDVCLGEALPQESPAYLLAPFRFGLGLLHYQRGSWWNIPVKTDIVDHNRLRVMGCCFVFDCVWIRRRLQADSYVPTKQVPVRLTPVKLAPSNSAHSKLAPVKFVLLPAPRRSASSKLAS